MVEFGTSFAFRRWVRVRVLAYGFGVRGKKVKSRDCALASDLVRAIRKLCTYQATWLLLIYVSFDRFLRTKPGSQATYLICKLAKPVYLCARGSKLGRSPRCVASRQGARSASHRVMQALKYANAGSKRATHVRVHDSLNLIIIKLSI